MLSRNERVLLDGRGAEMTGSIENSVGDNQGLSNLVIPGFTIRSCAKLQKPSTCDE
jgi:hypothetical protein